MHYWEYEVFILIEGGSTLFLPNSHPLLATGTVLCSNVPCGANGR